MHSEAMKSQAAANLGLIERAFADRSAPSAMTDSVQLSDAEYAEVMSFRGLRWQDVTFEHVQQYSDAVFWFSPTAFCYYLPGLLAPGLREMRWPLLSADEIEAVASWVRWLETVEPTRHPDPPQVAGRREGSAREDALTTSMQMARTAGKITAID
jgi:hypothetical protein